MSYVAIIPSLGALGPLGLLALVAPAVFAGLMLWIRRWSAALGAASAMTTVFLFQAWWQAPLRPMWWSTRAGLWAVLAGLAGTFYVWALNRTRPVSASEVNAQRVDKFALTFALIVSGVWTTFMIAASRWSESLGLVAIVVFISVVMAMIALHHRRCAETVLLTALALGCVSVSALESIRAIFSSELRVEWVFEADRPGAFLNSPLVADDRIYLGAADRDGFHQDGSLYAVDRKSGRPNWAWQSDPIMRPIYGTPSLQDSRLYVGEGLHSDHGCRLRCLEVVGHAPTEQWAFETRSHIESSPVLTANHVYFGAGDDGLYCLDAESGRKVWRLESLHIDATPLVRDGVVYVGSYRAEDNEHKDLRLLALNAATGVTVWSEPIDLSCYSQPTIKDSMVYFSLGTGDFESSGAIPAGAVVAIDAATGQRSWRTDLPDSVFGSPSVYGEFVVATCRNGAVFALNQPDGRMHWRYDMGSPIIAAPSIDYDHGGPFVLAVAKSGRCAKLSLWTGTLRNEIDLVRTAQGTSGLFTAAPVVSSLKGVGRRIYVAGAITRGIRESPILFCLMDGY